MKLNRMPIKPFLLSTVALLIGIMISLAVVEVGVRSFNLDEQKLPDWEDRPHKYFLHEGVHSLQDQHQALLKSKDTLRIGVIGDSFTFGPYLQVDDTFPSRLERWWNLNKEQQKVEVINYGITGLSTWQEIELVKKALSEDVDMLILAVTLNDPELVNYNPSDNKVNKFGQPIADTWLRREWKTWHLIQDRLENYRSVSKYKNYFHDLWYNNDTYGRFQSSVKEIAELSQQHQVPIVAVIFPTFGFLNDQSYPFFDLHSRAKEAMEAVAIKTLDLFKGYRHIPLDRLTVLPGRDRHPNEIAHRIAAEKIYNWLRHKNILPKKIFAKTVSPNRTSPLFQTNRTRLKIASADAAT